MSLTDCYEALKHLSHHPKIQKNNIFIAGWSFGGSIGCICRLGAIG